MPQVGNSGGAGLCNSSTYQGLLTNLIQLETKTLELVFVETRIRSGTIQLKEHRAYRWLMPEDLNLWSGYRDIPMVDR